MDKKNEKRGIITLGVGHRNGLAVGIGHRCRVKRCWVYESGQKIGMLEWTFRHHETGERLSRSERKRYEFTDWSSGKVTSFMAKDHKSAWARVVIIVGCGEMPAIGRQDLAVRVRIEEANERYKSEMDITAPLWVR